MATTKLTGIKKAIGNAKRSNFYRIYLNKTTGKVWTNTYASCNSWTQYQDKNIVEVTSGYGKYSIFGFNGFTMQELKQELQYA